MTDKKITDAPAWAEPLNNGWSDEPHYVALRDLGRLLPAQVRPVNSEQWVTVVGIKESVTKIRGKEIREFVLLDEDSSELPERTIWNPILTRTVNTDADELK